MKEPDIEIPAQFWKSLPDDAQRALFETGGIDAIQCARLWKMLGRTDPCPTFLNILISRADVDKVIAAEKEKALEKKFEEERDPWWFWTNKRTGMWGHRGRILHWAPALKALYFSDRTYVELFFGDLKVVVCGRVLRDFP